MKSLETENNTFLERFVIVNLIEAKGKHKKNKGGKKDEPKNPAANSNKHGEHRLAPNRGLKRSQRRVH